MAQKSTAQPDSQAMVATEEPKLELTALAADLSHVPGIEMLVAKPNPEYDGNDPEVEKQLYSRSTLSAEELKAVEDELQELGPMSTEQISDLVNQNTTSRFTSDGIFVLDGELLMSIDVRLRDPIFILEDNTIHTRKELLSTYPFDVFKMAPEDIFAQQEVGIFPCKASCLDKTVKDYLVRDLGSDEEFVLFEDMIGRWARKDKHVDRRPVECVVKTKIFLARDGWEDFMKVVSDFRAKQRILSMAMKRGAAPGLALLMNFGAEALALGGRDVPLALQTAEEAEVGRLKREEALAKKEAELAAKAAELDQQAAELAALIDSLNSPT